MVGARDETPAKAESARVEPDGVAEKAERGAIAGREDHVIE